MACGVDTLRTPLGERDELVAHVDERHPAAAPPQLEVEQAAVELERLVDRAHLERDVVDADRAGHSPSVRVPGTVPGTRPGRPTELRRRRRCRTLEW